MHVPRQLTEFTGIARAVHSKELRDLLGLDVEFIHPWGGAGVRVQLARREEIVPTKLVIVEATRIDALLVPGRGVHDLCGEYSRAICSIRELRDQAERRFGFGRLPLVAAWALPTMTQLDTVIRDRENARLLTNLVTPAVISHESLFWAKKSAHLKDALNRAFQTSGDDGSR